jgi:5S rRNA maturation endonuclease (ribonuclease M5)
MVDAMRELVLPRLESVKKSGAGFMARCPAHDDGTASLSIGPGRDQPVILHCHAGCHADDILARLDLTWADLSGPATQRTSSDVWTPAGPAIAVYDYRDEAGQVLFQVCRTANKEFRQRVPDAAAKGGYRWKLGDARRVLYRLPRLIEAVNGGIGVFICEGEKDVHTLEAHGLVATCNPGGAGKWREEYTEFLRDASVMIVADKDEPGRAHARQVREALTGVARDIEIVEAADGCKDVTEHAAAGREIADLVTTWKSEPDAPPELAPDLWQFLDTADDDFDWVVPGLLERGDRLMLTGYEGLGKSMLTRQLAVTIAAGVHPFRTARVNDFQPRRVLYIDCENSERQSRRKFRPLGEASVRSRRRVPDGGMRLIHKPNGLDLTQAADADWLMERVTAHQPDVLFIGPFYRLHNANLNEELPARRTVSVLDKARNSVGCALVIEAHAGHGNQINERDVRPVGSSLLLRWPEFGYGLAPVDKNKKLVHLRPWRGPRDERDWPKQLMWGDPNEWPWMECLTDEEMRGHP